MRLNPDEQLIEGISPDTPLLSKTKTPNKKQIIASHLFAADFNAQTVFTYFVSANGFWKHLAESTYAPDFILKHKESFDHNITELSKTWQYGMLASYVTGSAFLLIANQMSMPTRIAQFFGWETSAKNADKQNRSCKDHSILGTSIISALWKTLISSTSLLALFAPYVGFWAALGIAVAALPGNLIAQLSNFSEPFFKNLGAMHLPDWLKAGIVIYLTLGYCVSNMALYWNTIDQGFQRLHWMKTRLLQIQSLPLNLAVNAVHGIANLNFGVESYKSSSKRISNLISKQQTQTNVLVTNDTDIIIDIASQPNSTQNKPTFWKQTTKKAMAAAAYKTFSVCFALLAIIALAKPLDNFSWSVASIIVLALLASALNYVPQLTLFTSPAEGNKQNQGVGKLTQCFGYLAKCCPRAVVAPKQLEEGKGALSVPPPSPP